MKRRYSIIDNYQVSHGVWELVYWVWIGCSCNKKKKTVTIRKNRRPLLSDLMEADRVIPL